MPVSWRDAATSAIIDDTITADMADTDTVTVDTEDTTALMEATVTATVWDTEVGKNRLKEPRLPLNLPLLHPIKITRHSTFFHILYPS